jgi:hypothetical protein
MVAAAETLPTAPKCDRRPKRESIPRLWVSSEAYWRFRLLEQKNPVALAPDVSGRWLFTFRSARLSNKTSTKGHLIVLFFITKRSIKSIYYSMIGVLVRQSSWRRPGRATTRPGGWTRSGHPRLGHDNLVHESLVGHPSSISAAPRRLISSCVMTSSRQNPRPRPG